MKTIAQVLPGETLEAIVQETVPAEACTEEVLQFGAYLGRLNPRQLGSLQQELAGAARVMGRKIVMREKLLERLGTDWLRRQQEMIEGALAKIEVAKDTLDFNTTELELSGATWGISRLTNVLRLDEQAAADPLVEMIRHQQQEEETDIMGPAAMDDEQLEGIFGLR